MNLFFLFLFFFFFSTVFPLNFQLETNYCSHRMDPRRGKALVQEIFFKMQITRLELGSTPSRVQYKHLKTENPTNSANPLGWIYLNLVSSKSLVLNISQFLKSRNLLRFVLVKRNEDLFILSSKHMRCFSYLKSSLQLIYL